MTKHNLNAHLTWLLQRPCPVERQFHEFSHSTPTGSIEVIPTDAAPNLESSVEQIHLDPPHSPIAVNSNGVVSPASNNMPRLELASPTRPRIQMRSLANFEDNINPSRTPGHRKRDGQVDLSVDRSKTPKTKSKSCELGYLVIFY